MTMLRSLVCFLILPCLSLTFSINVNQRLQQFDDVTSDYPLFSSNEDRISARPTKCPAKEQWDECTSHCQKNCTNFDKPFPCPKICIPGCVCKEGLVRGPDRKCIFPTQCLVPNKQQLDRHSVDEKCPELQHFSLCDAFPSCQKDCSNYDRFIPCPHICFPGCVCDDGLVKGPDGNCIPPTQCPKSNEMEAVQDQFPMPILCNRDEIFSVCVGSCPDDCDNYKETDRKCNLICLPGCTCKRGTVRGPDGKCIKPEQCPKDKKPEDCTDYEYYDSCGTSCPDDCSNYNHPNRSCDKRCVIGCFCKPGYVRGPKGDCIFAFDCLNQQNDLPFNLLPSQQQRHISADPQRWDDAEPQTEAYNEESNMKYMPSESEAWRQLWDDAELQTEVFIEESAIKYKPLESEDASLSVTCPKHEHFTTCSAHKICEKNCTNYDKTIPCPMICVSGCICDTGLVRRSYPDGPCVRYETCPKFSEQQSLQRSFSNEEDNDEILQKRIASSSEVEEPILRRSSSNRKRHDYASGCPNESVCTAECIQEGRRYGICVGPRNRQCVCL